MTPHRSTAFPLIAAALLVAVSGCSPAPAPTTQPLRVSTTTVRATVPTFPAPRPPMTSVSRTARPGGAALSKRFATWADSLPGSVSVSVAGVGSESSTTLAPERGDHVAWSTIKVPLALAAIKSGTAPGDPSVEAALSESDNASAEALWASLGPPSAAASAVQTVLREGSDRTTTVQPRRVRSGYTPFGQTVWSVDDQATWAAHLPCLPGAGDALGPMRNVVSGQRWGFGSYPGAAIKGGWGPDESGAYLVRQLAVIQRRSGQTAVAVSAVPTAGTFAAGIDLIDRVAEWLRARIGELPSGRCG